MSVRHVGIAGSDNVSRRRIYDQLDCLELVELGDPVPPPKLGTLKRWRAEAPESFAFVVVAPAQLTATMRLDDDTAALLAAQVEALRARAVVYSTPPDLVPEPSCRRDVVATLEATPGGAIAVWEPHGVWGYELAQDLVARAGAVLAVDPLNLAPPYEADPPPPPPGPRGYFRIPVVQGLRESFAGWQLDEIVAAAARYEECFIVMAHPAAFADARRTRALVRED